MKEDIVLQLEDVKEKLIITEDEIEALRHGKKLYTQIMGGKYTITVELEK